MDSRKSITKQYEEFDENLFIKNNVPNASVVDKISLFRSGKVEPTHEAEKVTTPTTNNSKAKKLRIPHGFDDYFKASEPVSCSPKELMSKLLYIPDDNNDTVGELYQLPGINHHLFAPSASVYEDILKSVQEYDPKSTESNMAHWIFHVIESSNRWSRWSIAREPTDEDKVPDLDDDMWMALKEVTSLKPQLICNNDGSHNYRSGKLINRSGKLINRGTVLPDETTELNWNLMDGMHRAIALCQVCSTVSDTHPIHKLHVSIVVHKFLPDLTKTIKLNPDTMCIIMNSITTKSASIRDVNHKLTGTTNEGILLMIVKSSFEADTSDLLKPTFKQKSMIPLIDKVRARVQRDLGAITNQCLTIELKLQLENLNNSHFIKPQCIKSYFQTTVARPEVQKQYHLITLGTAISINKGMRDRFAVYLTKMDGIGDGFLNDSKLGKKTMK
jgi:hypothetical protein